MDRTKIFLEAMRGKESNNTSSGLNVELKGNTRLLPFGEVSGVISSLDQYREEREKCNTIRLTCQVNPICSNVLFNRISEIVKYEGSTNVTVLNYGSIGSDDSFANNQVIYKPKTLAFWSGGNMKYQEIDEAVSSSSPDTPIDDDGDFKSTLYSNGEITQNDSHPTNAIRDTQLSNDDDNGDHFVYHCGLDILNNHLVRTNTFKSICKLPSSYSPSEHTDEYTAFNTIADLMREANGDKVIEKMYFPASAGVDGGVKMAALHMYLYDDILPFDDAIKKRLIERHDGWFGFINKARIKSYLDFKNNTDMKTERPIMYKNGGDFVDMYPGRDLYSFVPKYNKYRKRMEKNWNYCITYPSSSTTRGFDDIIEASNNSLKTVYFDENTRADNGTKQLVMYSKAKHGLQPGDTVNIYKTYTDENDKVVNEKVVARVEVDTIVDEFIFTTFTQGAQISNKWVEVTSDDFKDGFTSDGVEYHPSTDGGNYFYDDSFNRYFVINGKYVNIDPKAQNITYKKTVNDIECEYYVRIFSRLPNFRFASGDTSNEYNIYTKQDATGDDKKNLLEIYQQPEYAFESQVSRLAFAKNIYSDEIGQIVFTDDINIANIHDNLGRPLTELYVTIVKNNAGYKQWYGFDGSPVRKETINSQTVEFSHCFGKITCGFEMSDESTGDTNANNIKTINNTRGGNKGYSVSYINKRKSQTPAITAEEIDFNSDVHFYGDLCYYDNYNALEVSIQPILHRFNTAQRESILSASRGNFEKFYYDEIYKDDYDTGDEFIIKSYTFDDCNDKPEGYYYIPHYKVSVKTFGTLESLTPQFLSIQSFVNKDTGVSQITTQEYHFLTPGDTAMIYDMSTDKYYNLFVVAGAGDNERIFTCKVTDENGNASTDLDGDNLSNYNLFKTDNMEAPSYAHLLKDGTCRFVWRKIINNGENQNIEEYPFTNGAFYINKKIDIYVRRQDPYEMYGLYSEDDIDVGGVEVSIENINDYYSEDDIQC